MRVPGWSLCFVLFAIVGAVLPITTHQEIQVERATEEEARAVQEIAGAFETRMRETRDVASLGDLFVNNFAQRQFTEAQASSSDRSVVLIPSIPLSLNADLARQVSQGDWERFYTAHFNLRYSFVLLIASRFKAGEIERAGDDVREKLFPVEVLALLRADPVLRGHYGAETAQTKYTIDNLNELNSLISTLEQVTLKLRQGFLKDPPEQTRIYQENLRRAPKKNPADSKRLVWPDLDRTQETRLGFPAGTRFFHRLTADSMFELWLVKTDAGLKITSARVYPFN